MHAMPSKLATAVHDSYSELAFWETIRDEPTADGSDLLILKL